MKKKVLAGLLASATVLGMFVAGGTALADEKDSHDTGVGIGFSGHTTPPGTDDFTLKWAPINFDFGSSNTVNAAAQAFNEDTGAKKYVVVSDGRAETGAEEWKLTAKLTPLVSGSSSLTGATLSFDSAKKAYVGTASPETAGSILAPSASHTATVAGATQTLTPGAAAITVMSDAQSSYKGDTAMEMDNIKLNVPGGVAVEGKQYSGKLTWSLDDVI